MIAETEHLIIREPVSDDWRGAHTFLTDAEVMRWIHLGPEPYTSEAQSQQWIADLIFYNGQQPRMSYNFVIIERATGQVIGWIGGGRPSPHWHATGDFDFGYALDRSQQGKGYMTEALIALLNFAFTELSIQTAFAICETRNTGSWRVMEKAGMTQLKRYIEAERGYEMFLYSITKAQFDKRPKT